MSGMNIKRNILWFILLLTFCFSFVRSDGVEVYNSIFHFPEGSPYMGIFVAIAIPLNNKGLADVFFSMNFEASYSLPQNQTRFVFPPIIGNSTSRKFVYSMLETNMDSYGVPGKQCLLRSICEAAEYSIEGNGILGDLFHILLTPSSSTNENELTEYSEAEQYGKDKRHCKKYIKKCVLSLLKFVSNLKKGS